MLGSHLIYTGSVVQSLLQKTALDLDMICQESAQMAPPLHFFPPPLLNLHPYEQLKGPRIKCVPAGCHCRI